MLMDLYTNYVLRCLCSQGNKTKTKKLIVLRAIEKYKIIYDNIMY